MLFMMFENINDKPERSCSQFLLSKANLKKSHVALVFCNSVLISYKVSSDHNQQGYYCL